MKPSDKDGSVPVGDEQEAEAEENTNCLAGMKCPKCGYTRSFHIGCSTIAEVLDSGVEDHGNMEWDAESYCLCGGCDFEGEVKDFQAPDEPAP